MVRPSVRPSTSPPLYILSIHTDTVVFLLYDTRGQIKRKDEEGKKEIEGKENKKNRNCRPAGHSIDCVLLLGSSSSSSSYIGRSLRGSRRRNWTFFYLRSTDSRDDGGERQKRRRGRVGEERDIHFYYDAQDFLGEKNSGALLRYNGAAYWMCCSPSLRSSRNAQKTFLCIFLIWQGTPATSVSVSAFFPFYLSCISVPLLLQSASDFLILLPRENVYHPVRRRT